MVIREGIPSIVVDDAFSCLWKAALRPAGVVVILGIVSVMLHT
jgi:hypothetical protein